MKHIKLLALSLLSIVFATAQTQYAKIVVYRIEISQPAVNDSYEVYANEVLTTRLQNKHFDQFYKPEGKLSLRVGAKQWATQQTDISKGNTYYFKIYINPNLPNSPITINPVDSITAQAEIKKMGKIKTNKTTTSEAAEVEQPNALGLSMEIITGLNKIALLKTKNGTIESLNFGGDGAVGISYSHELTDNYGYLLELQDRFSAIYLENDESPANFNTGVISVSPYYAFPIKWFINQKFKFGAGLDYSFSPQLSFSSSSSIVNSFNDLWKYKNSLGYHVHFLLDTKVGKRLKIHTGIKYYDVKYKLASTSSYTATYNSLKNPHANSISATVGLEYCF